MPRLYLAALDQNGAIVVDARVTVRSSSDFAKTVNTDKTGVYSFANLRPGEHTVEASAPSLGLQGPLKITMQAGTQALNLQLKVFISEQNIIHVLIRFEVYPYASK